MDEPFTRLARRVGTDDQLSPTARLLFAALDGYLDKRTGHCAPTLARLAGWIGRDRRNVIRALRQLEAAGYVAVNRSSGRRNAYRLLPTSDENATGTSDENVTGTGRAYRIGFLRTKEKEQAPPPRPLDLFTGHYRDWFTAAVGYHLGEVPDLAELVPWFPAAAADFFLAQSWHRTSDPETVVHWARRLRAIAATEAEALEAFAWALGTPGVDATGRKLFSRPDHLARLTFRILSQRKRNDGRPALGPITEPAAADSPGPWASATEAERVEVLAVVDRLDLVPNGLRFTAACAAELARIRGRVNV